jgi:hypothetical protein
LIRLYPALGSDELADIAAYGGFRPGPNSLLGKWFAETPQAARSWGQLLHPGDVFHVVHLNVPQDLADQMFRLPLLDQIGPARYAEGDLLASINQQHQGIAEVP